MNHKLALSALAAAAALALPSAAQAGTSTTTSSASFAVADQCTVTGATVNLGTYTSTQTWGDVAAVWGTSEGNTRYIGTKGTEGLEYGQVLCSNGLPYTLVVKGNWSTGFSSTFVINGRTTYLVPMFKSLGGVVLPDVNNSNIVGFGTRASFNISGTGTGVAQVLRGTMLVGIDAAGTPNGTFRTTQLATNGQVSTPLTYTLTF